MQKQWLDWARRIQALSQSGLAFSKDAFDRERYEELREISAEMIASHTNVQKDDVIHMFKEEKGYQTPKVDVRGVVFKENRVLLVKEKMDQKWALPGGFCDVGLSPSENIVKEIKEEAGFDVTPTKLLAVLDTNKHGHEPQPFHFYKLFIQCTITGGTAKKGLETGDVRFFGEHELPELSLRRNTPVQLKMVFEHFRNPSKETLVD
ncbi:NUDIX hydrolase [Alteribacter aurantiacus]|uniref:NUDIX hydrolase n=1 Tax=Alteribacter aurantiacus TaxID=254410 RepID=UPI0003FEC04F|nr:NUDIX hydrolase [Alteribacter aurantiacus]